MPLDWLLMFKWLIKFQQFRIFSVGIPNFHVENAAKQALYPVHVADVVVKLRCVANKVM